MGWSERKLGARISSAISMSGVLNMASQRCAKCFSSSGDITHNLPIEAVQFVPTQWSLICQADTTQASSDAYSQRQRRSMLRLTTQSRHAEGVVALGTDDGAPTTAAAPQHSPSCGSRLTF